MAGTHRYDPIVADIEETSTEDEAVVAAHGLLHARGRRRAAQVVVAAAACLVITSAAVRGHVSLRGSVVGDKVPPVSINVGAIVGEEVLESQLAGCQGGCPLHGDRVDCSGLVIWAALRMFADRRDPCLEAYTFALVNCSSCWGCHYRDMGCLEPPPELPTDPGVAGVPDAVWPPETWQPELHERAQFDVEQPPLFETIVTGDYVNHYDAANPLRIRVAPERSRNYFLVIGDWGKSGGAGPCQAAVAEKMKRYIEKQKAAGNNLLFVGSVGDNFYWTGVTPEAWDQQWASVYGAWDPSSALHHVPWLSVMGNHDLGNNDPYALCPGQKPLQYVEGQPYGSQQFNADRNPLRPDSGCDDAATVDREPARCSQNTSFYWMPDYSYHYELPEANLEVIALDRNAESVDEIGGDASGHDEAFAVCGGRDVVEAHFRRVDRAADKLLAKRAAEGTASTVVIMQHYPERCKRDVFERALPAWRRGQVRTLCVYGHAHEQRCDGRDAAGVCRDVLSGGGGGCCGPEVSSAGFTAVHLDDAGGFFADVDSADVRLPQGSCAWAGPGQVLPERIFIRKG